MEHQGRKQLELYRVRGTYARTNVSRVGARLPHHGMSQGTEQAPKMLGQKVVMSRSIGSDESVISALFGLVGSRKLTGSEKLNLPRFRIKLSDHARAMATV